MMKLNLYLKKMVDLLVVRINGRFQNFTLTWKCWNCPVDARKGYSGVYILFRWQSSLSGDIWVHRHENHSDVTWKLSKLYSLNALY